jgi:hypothetical protein
MSMNEGWFRRERLVRLRAPTEKTLVAAILIAFFILHVIGGMILQRPSSQNDTFDVVLSRAID